jgi:hypothetical protein
MRISPYPGCRLVFGRNEPQVDVCVGADDPYVSREQGSVSHDGSRWVLRNLGRVPLRLPGSLLVRSGQSEVLPSAYAPLFVVCPHREHLLELRIATAFASDTPDLATRQQLGWALNERERLVLASLGQRYLRHEADPRPLTWIEAGRELAERWPDEPWDPTRLARIVDKVRDRLGVPGDSNEQLLIALLASTTLVPTDLRLLGG